MTPCPDREPLIHALIDGELDAANTLAVEAHMAACPGCAALYADLAALRSRLATPGLSPASPPGLGRAIEARIAAEVRERRPARAIGLRKIWARLDAGWASAGAMAAVAASLLVVQIQSSGAPGLGEQLVADHVRSTLATHLVDVATSDRHVVKPWFNGKVDFAPPVPELADAGFPLVGGRLDYADGQRVAAVVYRRRAHVINLFVLPANPRTWTHAWTLGQARTGYSVVRWRRGGLEFWAVSDLEAAELERFRQAFDAHAPT